jgi:predicted P-loop ATPase
VQIHSAWIYELAELENVVTGRAESRLKAWLTSTHDMYRAPYARTAVRKSRSVALCGTTNRSKFLTDDTGSRRFWIVPVNAPIPKDLLIECRDQLWAEAVNAVESGEPWWLGNESEDLREEANREFEDEDPWADAIESWLRSPGIQETTATDLLREAIKVDVAKQDRWSQMRVSRILASLGWERRRASGSDRQRVWKRPATQHVMDLTK